eukprot:INCI18381.1.p1 GENE.INCI18381.1~~INCI18381.1.p1  ORF type:complete len:408 (+),score=55.66 INCI18381.1:169-1392(+)
MECRGDGSCGSCSTLTAAAEQQTAAAHHAEPPVIDVGPLIVAFGGAAGDKEDVPGLQAAVVALRDACTEWGFFQCLNHGVDSATAAAFDSECRRFFALPRTVKARIKRTKDNSRGWFDDELTKQTRDWKECVDIGCPGRTLVDGENQWPDPSEAPGFRPAVDAYFKSCLQLSRILLRACAVGLGMRPGHFDTAAEPHTSYLRLNYYPVCPAPVASESHGFSEPDPSKDGLLGINKHTDAGCLTVLRQSHLEPASLQVFRPDGRVDGAGVASGQWHRVVPIEGALTINIGDMMQVWSNDRYRAPVHRVLANRERERYSAPFFYNPSYDSMIEPVASCGSPRYRPLSWGEFRRRRFEGDFGDDSPDVQISDWAIGEGLEPTLHSERADTECSVKTLTNRMSGQVPKARL